MLVAKPTDFPKRAIRVWSKGRTDDEAQEVCRRADHCDFAEAGGWIDDSGRVPHAQQLRSVKNRRGRHLLSEW